MAMAGLAYPAVRGAAFAMTLETSQGRINKLLDGVFENSTQLGSSTAWALYPMRAAAYSSASP